MKRTVLLAALAFLSAAPPPASAKPTPVKRDVYEVRTRRELDAFEAKIEVLEAQARMLGVEARERAEERARDLRMRENGAERLLDALETSAGKARKDLHIRVDRSVRDLRAAYSQAVSKKP
jgi:hypothetical protein